MKEYTYGVSISADTICQDGTADASSVIQTALDSGSPLIHLPYGNYRLDKGLLISSGTRLVVHPKARLFLGDGVCKHAHNFLLSNRNPERGDTAISISGGIWDGNNRNNPRGQEGDADAYTGTLINMKNVSDYEMRDMMLKDSTAYFTRLTRVRNFRIENITFQITHPTRNQDGIHCAGYCENGEIHNISAYGLSTTGDDLIALNADDALLRSELLGAEVGPIKNIRISNIRADDCHSFVRLASVWEEIANIDIRGVHGGCSKMALNADALRYCRVPLFNTEHLSYANGVGMLRNIRYSDANIHKTKANNSPLFCLETRMDNLRLFNIKRNLEQDALPNVPTLTIRNVHQNCMSVEYRRHKARNEQHSMKIYSVAGTDDIIRKTVTERFSRFDLTTEHILNMHVGKPVIHDLPPANNNVGLSP